MVFEQIKEFCHGLTKINHWNVQLDHAYLAVDQRGVNLTQYINYIFKMNG